ncbi:putative Heme-regulated two-component response regulator [Paraburkholderia caribensis MBA4]|uniref:Diguanylate cyclase DosC n=1 Tax=Paraburkholderia caribensis MBA4 TaxID=1323664 RepID=A0A0P0RJQ7_9BURK|nr:diguanylate cyclase [Paraburkholderia caribensis]ALL68942.1 putative Heme-regulated two-component response regulator [Paraburkholderia caribensis MBA4]
MLKLDPDQLENDWRDMLAGFSPDTVATVRQLADLHRRELATYFYQQMLNDPIASRLVSHDQVKSHLHSSMTSWVKDVFAVSEAGDLQLLIEQLVKIGEVHGRIDVPVHLVIRGARNLKEGFFRLLQASGSMDKQSSMSAARLVSSVIDMAMEMMSFAYSSSHDRNSRAEEAYRLLSVVENVAAEQERQRAALLDWENAVMFEQAVNPRASDVPRLQTSEFGLWYRHKGAAAFEGTVETSVILDAMDRIDNELLPLVEGCREDMPQRKVQLLRDLHTQTNSIEFSLDTLFKQSNEVESGRDVLTRLLNRKFLPVVLSKEVKYARRKNTNFAVLAIDIDHFKSINDTYGHESGDMVLQQLAGLLINCCRGGDYTFRLGGEEFLVVLVDVTEDSGKKVAEKLLRLVAETPFRVASESPLRVSISVGVAFNNGHPDYQRTLNLADEALYTAKRTGRNRVTVAADAQPVPAS